MLVVYLDTTEQGREEIPQWKGMLAKTTQQDRLWRGQCLEGRQAAQLRDLNLQFGLGQWPVCNGTWKSYLTKLVD